MVDVCHRKAAQLGNAGGNGKLQEVPQHVDGPSSSPLKTVKSLGQRNQLAQQLQHKGPNYLGPMSFWARNQASKREGESSRPPRSAKGPPWGRRRSERCSSAPDFPPNSPSPSCRSSIRRLQSSSWESGDQALQIASNLANDPMVGYEFSST